MNAASASHSDQWPALPLEAWADTCATLHLWTQIVGKVRLTQSPFMNHSWNSTLYVTARGLTTSPLPHGPRTFQIDFDFVEHRLIVHTSDGGSGGFALAAQPVATFYSKLMAELEKLSVPVRIYAKPNEVAEPIPFATDHAHRAYDPEFANRYWRVLAQSDRVFKEFRGRFIGKCSPVHYFWGAPDLAVTRFSGRVAPQHPGGIPNLPDRVTREAYSHEVSSCGFWPGGGPVPHAAFYSYAYPEPAGFSTALSDQVTLSGADRERSRTVSAVEAHAVSLTGGLTAGDPHRIGDPEHGRTGEHSRTGRTVNEAALSEADPEHSRRVRAPSQAFYHPDMKEFLLPYDAVRLSPSPDATLLEFLQSTYEAAANLAKWDRKSLERA